MNFGMYPEIILFIAGGFFALVALTFVVYLIAFRKRSREYARVLEHETEIFDALTATATITQNRRLTSPSPSRNITEDIPISAPHMSKTMGETVDLFAHAGIRHQYVPTGPQDSSGFDPSVIAHAYTIEREVGGGAMSRTFVVRNNKLGNLWFLKFISKMHGTLANEENILKLLNHSSLPRIVDVFHREHGVYLIVTLVEGIPLNMLEETEIKVNQYVLVDWFEQVAQALNYLHSIVPSPVFHLDLKPGNIMVTHDNRLVLVDFGIARHFGEGSSGAVTATYAAPEQFGGRIPQKFAQLMYERFGMLPPESARWYIDARTDIFSLGVIMFELATGQSPTQRNMKILTNHVSRDIAAVIHKCLSVDPAGRYHSVVELLEALRKVKGSKIKMARSLFMRRIASVAAVAAVVLSVGFFAGGYNVFAFENAATLASQPDIVTVSLQQSTAVSIERHLQDGTITHMDSTQIIWEASRDNIAHIDGGRVTGMNIGETIITGRHRNSDVRLNVRVVEPMDGMIQISQRFQVGRTASVFAGTATRERVDGNMQAMNFFSPESMTITESGAIYLTDAGVIRRISGGAAETIHKDLNFISADMIRSRGNDIYILTAPWQEVDGRYVTGIARIAEGIVEIIYESDAVHTAIEDFTFGPDGLLYFILRNEGLGVIFLKTMDTRAPNNINIVTPLPAGSTSLTTATDGAVYIGNTTTGVIQVFINGELRNFAGLAYDLAFIDGTSPRFYSPQRLTYHTGYLYIWDFNTLRRIQANRGIAGEAISIAGMASPVYDRELSRTVFAAEDVILPHGRLIDIAVLDNGILISDHKRGVIWHVNY